MFVTNSLPNESASKLRAASKKSITYTSYTSSCVNFSDDVAGNEQQLDKRNALVKAIASCAKAVLDKTAAVGGADLESKGLKRGIDQDHLKTQAQNIMGTLQGTLDANALKATIEWNTPQPAPTPSLPEGATRSDGTPLNLYLDGRKYPVTAQPDVAAAVAEVLRRESMKRGGRC